jgi:hypothetical protein
MRKAIAVAVGAVLLVLLAAVSGFAQQTPTTPQQGGESDRYAPHAGGPAPTPNGLQAGRVVDLKKQAPLLFREDFKNGAGNHEHFVSQADLVNANLELKIYGDKSTYMAVDMSPDTPGEILFSGLCLSTCAIALRDKANYMDLSGIARVRWRTRQSGFHILRPIVKLADGTWLIGDHGDGYTTDWVISEFSLYDVRWRHLDIEQVIEDKPDAVWTEHPDLTKVEEIGFTDLMKGSGHGGAGSSRVDWIEVYGKWSPRAGSADAPAKSGN